MASKPPTIKQTKSWFNQYINSFKYAQTTHHQIPTTNTTTIEVDGHYEDQLFARKRFPIVMPAISLIMVALFVIDVVQTKDMYMADGIIAQTLEYHPSRKKELWRWITYMLVHLNVGHIFTNVVFQVIFAIPLEMVLGYWRVMAVFLCGVLAGSVGVSIGTPMIRLVGASGGTYSLITVHLALVIMNWKAMDKLRLIHLGVPSVLIVFDVANSLITRYYLQKYERISYIAHLCGGMAGLLIGLALFKIETPEEHKFKMSIIYRILQGIGIVIYVAFIVYGIVWNIDNSK